MIVAVTGATGFVGRYLVRHLVEQGHSCRCLYREGSDRRSFDAYDHGITWCQGQIGNPASCYNLVDGSDAVVHAALDRAGRGFRGSEGEITSFVRSNVLGTIELIEEARAANVPRFVFVSTCAVHERILDDRPLDEAHPLWPLSHYGAAKAAVEKFVASYGFGQGYSICSIRPCGIYGVAHPFQHSKWYPLVRDVTVGLPVRVRGGGKEVHASDVARAILLLLEAENVAGESYSCCDQYISEYHVAEIAREIAGSGSEIRGEPTEPKHQIDTTKIRSLGMEFGGEEKLRDTIGQLVELARD